MRRAARLLRWAVVLELSMYRNLYRWARRRPYVPEGGVAFAHVGAVQLLLWVFVIVSAIELVVLHVLIPWEQVRLVADILGIWGLLWMLGLTASLHVRPHVIEESGIRLRCGMTVEAVVPWEHVAGAKTRERSRERSRSVQVDEDDGVRVLHVVAASRTSVDLQLLRPVTVALAGGPVEVSEIRLYVDDARGFAAAVRERVAAGRSVG